MEAIQVRHTVIAMLAAETGCEPDQLKDGNIHIVARMPTRTRLPEHRRFNPHPGRIAAVTLGTGAVISVDPADVQWAAKTFTAPNRDALFRGDSLCALVQRAARDNLTVHGPYTRFTAPLSAVTNPGHSPGYTVSVVDIETEMAENPDMIDRSKFPNALFPGPGVSGRPTVFAAVAIRHDTVIGIAGVSKDSDFMYQIGIDILSAHRGNGLAAAMTAAASKAVIDVGGLPYYGTTNSNVPSMRTALAAGLRPTWVEVLTRPA